MTKQIKTVVYGEGGFDESKPENNVVEIVYYSKEELAQMAETETKESARQAILDRLGLSNDEVKLLLG